MASPKYTFTREEILGMRDQIHEAFAVEGAIEVQARIDGVETRGAHAILEGLNLLANVLDDEVLKDAFFNSDLNTLHINMREILMRPACICDPVALAAGEVNEGCQVHDTAPENAGQQEQVPAMSGDARVFDERKWYKYVGPTREIITNGEPVRYFGVYHDHANLYPSAKEWVHEVISSTSGKIAHVLAVDLGEEVDKPKGVL